MTLGDNIVSKKDIAKLAALTSALAVVLVAVLTTVFQFVGPLLKPTPADGSSLQVLTGLARSTTETAVIQREIAAATNDGLKELRGLRSEARDRGDDLQANLTALIYVNSEAAKDIKALKADLKKAMDRQLQADVFTDRIDDLEKKIMKLARQ